MTKKNRTRVAENLAIMKGERPRKPVKMASGQKSGHGKEGPRILFVDDRADVLQTFVKADRDYHSDTPALPCQMTFYHLPTDQEDRAEEFKSWLKNQHHFDAIFLDGELGPDLDGVRLAEEISTLPSFAYQPVAIITANASFYKDSVDRVKSSPYRVLGKFDAGGKNAIQSLVVSVEDVSAHARERFWADTQFEIASLLDVGTEVEEVANVLGGRLKEHFRVSGWYLRELKNNKLSAIASNDDEYDAGSELELGETPDFLRDLALGKTSRPWTVTDALDEEDVAGRLNMIGHKGIAARVGSKVVGDLTAVITAYRRPEEEPFTEADARQLHQLAVLIRLAMTPERTTNRLNALSSAINDVLASSSTEEITSRMSDFIQEQIHLPLESRGAQTKAITSLFLRGRGELVRWGQELRKVQGQLEAGSVEKIRISDDTVITRCVHTGVTKWSRDPEERGLPFRNDTQVEICSYLGAPLKHDGAILGVLNLETTEKDGYLERDKSLVEAVAQVAAAAIFDYRGQRFSSELAALTAIIVDPVHGETSNPDKLLGDAAQLLYRLTGFSEMLMFGPQSDPNMPWIASKGWTGGDEEAQIIGKESLKSIDKFVAPRWEETFLKMSLDSDDSELGVHRGKEGLDDIGFRALGKAEWQRTLSHMVMLLGTPGQRTSAIMLLFEHPHPVPAKYDYMFAAFARYLETVERVAALDLGTVSKHVATLTVEAKASRALSQARHDIAGIISILSSRIKSGIKHGEDPVELLESTRQGLIEAESSFETAKMIMRVPVIQDVLVRRVLNEQIRKLQPRMKQAGFDLKKSTSKVKAKTDPNFLGFTVFHLLENAMTHGKRNGATSINVNIDNNSLTVCDNGKELTPRNVDGLFELGYTTSADGGGHGLHIASENAREAGLALKYCRRDGSNCFSIKFNR